MNPVEAVEFIMLLAQSQAEAQPDKKKEIYTSTAHALTAINRLADSACKQ